MRGNKSVLKKKKEAKTTLHLFYIFQMKLSSGPHG